MSKKNYVEIAALVKRHFGVVESWRKDAKTDRAIHLFVGGLIDHFRADNPRFDEIRFAKACGF